MLSSGLDQEQQPYTIKLKPNAHQFSFKTPRHIPLSLVVKVKKELLCMECIDVISHVEQATEWCAGMGVVTKKSGDPHICVNLTQLNKSVHRGKYTLPSVKQTLSLLAGSKIFSKLNANLGFWQILLMKESTKLIIFISLFSRLFFKRFGIASSPEHFQNRMSTEVTESLEEVICYIDDMGTTHKMRMVPDFMQSCLSWKS